MIKKRGLSPVIATVLLIAIVVVLGLIVFLWIRGIVGESLVKFDGRNVQLVCDEVEFEAEYSSSTGFLYFSNTGNVPIYKIKAKISGAGSYSTVVVGESDGSWPETGANPGGLYSGLLSETAGADSILIIPVLIGKTSSGEKKSYTCEERQGKEIPIN